MERKHWDIFCAVVDNYGDIGVAWRLARRLAHDFGLEVRPWVAAPAGRARIARVSEPDRSTL
ncbi:elongation factor P maturation arginine rhamnosyltransferase EarP, partial [Pseudomonas sp. MWU13-2860]